jgi:hypothetical protein
MKHYKSFFTNEQECLKAILEIHNEGKAIEVDPMYFKGNFYKEIAEPKYKFDLNPVVLECVQANAINLPLNDKSVKSIILDPPFLFGVHGKTKNYYSSKTHTIFNTFNDLEITYKGILKEAYRILEKKGILIFKCQDYTDSKTTMTHCFVYNWAIELGFYADDLAILNIPQSKVYNGNLNQRHFRKTHTYFWVFKK